MRTFEILACLLTLPPIVMEFSARRQGAFASYATLALSIAIILQIGLERAHWQLYPLYLAVLILCLGYFLHARLPWWACIFAGCLSLLLVGATVALSWTVPMFRLPKPTGSYAVGTQIFHLVDQNRVEISGPSPGGRRELMVQAWYPAESPALFRGTRAVYQRRQEVTWRGSYRSVLKTNSRLDAAIAPGGPYPILLYNPGWTGERTEGTYQMEELASHGFFVVAIDHTFYGGLVAFPDGRVTDSRGSPEIGNFENSNIAEQWALGTKYVRIEAEDDMFVLDQFAAMNNDPKDSRFGRLDMNRVGAMGFSIGGAVASQTAYQDSRVKAALNLDGWTFGDAGAQGLAKPWMVIYEDRVQTVPTAVEMQSGSRTEQLIEEADAEDYARVLGSMKQNGGYLLFISGTHHVDFTDRSLFSPLRSRTGGGALDPTQTHAIVNAYTLAFFSHVLNGTPSPLLSTVPSPHPEVDYQRFAGAAQNTEAIPERKR